MGVNLFDGPEFGRVAFETQSLATPGGQLLDDDIPPPPEPLDADDPARESPPDGEPTTWEPVDLGPYLRGEVERPQPSLGITRSDGVRLIYPGCEHAVLGETESGKTWFALGCTAAQLLYGDVVYIHYEESDAGSTIEKLRLLGVADSLIDGRLRFVAPARPVRAGWMEALLDPPPSLVVHDGVNEGMAMHTSGQDVDGWSSFRRRLILPCLKTGAAVLSCDHVPMNRDGGRRDAYGTVHKGNTLDGARIALENVQPFGRRMRGASYVFITKDRPGHLRTHGRPTKTPGKTFMGTLVVDDSETVSPDFGLMFFAPKAADANVENDPVAEMADTVHAVIAALPDHAVSSMRELFAAMRAAGHAARNSTMRDVVDDLLVAGRLVEVSGKRGACGYQAVLTASQESPA